MDRLATALTILGGISEFVWCVLWVRRFTNERVWNSRYEEKLARMAKIERAMSRER